MGLAPGVHGSSHQESSSAGSSGSAAAEGKTSLAMMEKISEAADYYVEDIEDTIRRSA